MGLLNVEEECAFLRQRCTDFEDQLGKHREDYDALFNKYTEVKHAIFLMKPAWLYRDTNNTPF
jgi:hypothetical protein